MDVSAIKVDKSSRYPVYAQIEGQLMELIKGGAFEPTEPLPDERSFSASLGVTRVTLRRALAKLEHAGLVYKIRGKGVFPRKVVSDASFVRFDVPNRRAVAIAMPELWESHPEQHIRLAEAERLRRGRVETMVMGHVSEADELAHLARCQEVIRGVLFHRWGTQASLGNIEAARRFKLHVLVCGNGKERFDTDFVGADVSGCFRRVTEHFIAAGHRDILFVSQNVPLEPKAVEVYTDTVRAAGLRPLTVGRYACPPFSSRERAEVNVMMQGYLETAAVLRGKLKATAIIAESPCCCVGVLKALDEAGVAVPEDVELLAFGDAAEVEDCYGPEGVPFSTFSLPLEEIGEKAADTLLWRLDHPDAPRQSHEFEPEFVQRRTTRPLGSKQELKHVV